MISAIDGTPVTDDEADDRGELDPGASPRGTVHTRVGVGASVYAAIGGSGESLEWWQGGLVLAGYAVVLTAVGAVTSWRRDVT